MQRPNSEQHAYWCTWLTQNYIAEKQSKESQNTKANFVGDQGARLARAVLTEETLFGEDGLADRYEKERGDLYLLLDDGWDVPFQIHPDKNAWAFGSLEVAEDRFPSVRGKSPAERLKILSQKAKAKGWKGLGIWIAAQCSGTDYQAPFVSEAQKDYWKQRIAWSKEAGIRYWKVDWGTYAWAHEFRSFLSETARALYPELVIEHAICMAPLNGVRQDVEEAYRGRFQGDKEESSRALQAVEYSEVFRTYDVLAPISVSSTLDRAAYLLPHAKGYLNVEDELYIAAALGCQMGVMRSVYGANLSGKSACYGRIQENVGTECDRLDEVTAAVAWQKIAPPFQGGACLTSEEILFDDYTFADGETWFSVAHGKTIKQGAPMAIARNVVLPTISAGATGEKPFVVSALHPNGNFSIGILPRTIHGKNGYVGGEIDVSLHTCPAHIAVFGKADKIVLHLDGAKKIRNVFVRSLPDDEEKETAFSTHGQDVVIEREWIEKTWQSKDKSSPAFLFRLLYE